jgi:hypothetical protein
MQSSGATLCNSRSLAAVVVAVGVVAGAVVA